MSVLDTIVALASPVGESALAIIRVSGAKSVSLFREITGAKGKTSYREAIYSKYMTINGLHVDSCVFVMYKKGKSPTGEEMLEITSHGSPMIIQSILEDLQERSCRMAEPGEFSKRAFLNGKMDLTQAEAVMDLISARSILEIQLSINQLEGAIGQKMASLTDMLISILAEVEAYIDFPDEDLPKISENTIKRKLAKLIEELDSLIETNRYSALLQGGLKALIIGAPNVGKSSLVNELTGSERVIVSKTPGTTRDLVPSSIVLNRLRLEVVDSAGLRETNSAIEKEGINRVFKEAKKANFFLIVLDSGEKPPSLPEEILPFLKRENSLVIENKTDLAKKYDQSDYLKNIPHFKVSIKNGSGIKELKEQMEKAFSKKMDTPNLRSGIALNSRHTFSLKQAKKLLKEALQNIGGHGLREICASDLRGAIDCFSQVVGQIDNEKVLDKVFEKFCIGK